MKYPVCKECGCEVVKMYKHSNEFSCGSSHNFYLFNDWSISRQCKIISELKNTIVELKRGKA